MMIVEHELETDYSIIRPMKTVYHIQETNSMNGLTFGFECFMLVAKVQTCVFAYVNVGSVY